MYISSLANHGMHTSLDAKEGLRWKCTLPEHSTSGWLSGYLLGHIKKEILSSTLILLRDTSSGAHLDVLEELTHQGGVLRECVC